MGKHLSEEYITPIRDAFSLFDTDRYRYITTAELGTVIQGANSFEFVRFNNSLAL